MSNTLDDYWRIKLKKVHSALEANHFESVVVNTLEDARKLVMDKIAPAVGGGIVSWGGSLTVHESGLKEAFRRSEAWEVVSSDGSEYGEKPSAEEKLEARRRGLLSDLYLLGCNAVTEDGLLVNLDMIGNRVAALTFGPRKVVVLAGRNKVCADLYAAMERIREN